MVVLHLTGKKKEEYKGADFGVVDGGHRLRAMQLLLKEGRIPQDYQARCTVLAKTTPWHQVVTQAYGEPSVPLGQSTPLSPPGSTPGNPTPWGVRMVSNM